MMKQIVGLLLLLVVAKIVFINSISPILTSHNATVVTTTTVVAATDTKEIEAVVIDDSSLAHLLEQGLCDTYESYPLVCGNNINIIQTVPYIVSPINGYLMWEKYGSITDNEDDDEYIQYFKESKAFFELQEFANFNEARMIGGFKYTQCKRKMSHINKWTFFCPRVICGNKNEEFKLCVMQKNTVDTTKKITVLKIKILHITTTTIKRSAMMRMGGSSVIQQEHQEQVNNINYNSLLSRVLPTQQ
jgi:hypothetical protein